MMAMRGGILCLPSLRNRLLLLLLLLCCVCPSLPVPSLAAIEGGATRLHFGETRPARPSSRCLRLRLRGLAWLEVSCLGVLQQRRFYEGERVNLTRVFGKVEKLRRPLRRLPKVPFIPSLPGFNHPNPVALLEDKEEEETDFASDSKTPQLQSVTRGLAPVPRNIHAGFAFAQRLLRSQPQSPKRSLLPLIDLVMSHTADSEYYFEEFQEHAHLSKTPEKADLEKGAFIRADSPFVKLLERLRFPSLIRLRPSELIPALRRGLKLLLPGGAEAAEASLRVLMVEAGWKASAAKRLFLSDPKEFYSPLPPGASETDAKVAFASIEECVRSLRDEVDRATQTPEEANRTGDEFRPKPPSEAALLEDAKTSLAAAERDLSDAASTLAQFCSERKEGQSASTSKKERQRQGGQEEDKEEASSFRESPTFYKLAALAAASKMRCRLRRWRELGFSARKLEALAEKRPQVLQQQRPETKLAHLTLAFKQVEASKTMAWGEGDAAFEVPESASSEDALLLKAEAALRRWEEEYDAQQAAWLPWWKREKEPDVLKAEFLLKTDDKRLYPKRQETEFITDNASRGLFMREVVPGEPPGQENDSEAEEDQEMQIARRKAKREWIKLERKQSDFFKALQKVRERRIKDLCQRYPRILSLKVESSVKNKLLYFQNCMYISLHEVLRFPRALTTCLYTRIMPRHIALVNEFLIRVHAVRTCEEDDTSPSEVPTRRDRAAEVLDDGAEAQVYRQFCRMREQFDFKKKLLQSQPLSVARARMHRVLVEQNRRRKEGGGASGGGVGATERFINKGPLDSFHDLLVLPPIHPLRGWRRLPPHQPLWCVPLPPLENILSSSDEEFCNTFRIPRRRLLEAKRDAESIPNPRRLF